jgi:predicted DNA-binding transcriptional regulator AlpA
MQTKLVTLGELAKRLNVSERKLTGWAMYHEDDFPTPYQIGDENFYDLAEILTWVREKKQEKKTNG